MPQLIIISLVELYDVLMGSSGSEVDAGQKLCHLRDMNAFAQCQFFLSKAAAKR
jgi:hypothetical protein